MSVLSKAQYLSVTPYNPQVVNARAIGSERLSKASGYLQDYAPVLGM